MLPCSVTSPYRNDLRFQQDRFKIPLLDDVRRAISGTQIARGMSASASQCLDSNTINISNGHLPFPPFD
jgi:hypothetical protein